MAKVSQNNALIALALIVIGVLIVAFMLTKETPPVDNEEVDEHYSGADAQNFNFLMPEAWSYTDNAMKDVQTLTPGQVLQFGIVPSKNDNGVYYFAAAAPDPKVEGNTLWSVYQYNSDYTFERIYRVSYGPEKGLDGIREGAEIALHPIGHDGYKLIIMAQDAMSSPGVCAEVLTFGREADDEVYEMLSLDLLEPYHSGLQPYEVPDDIYDQALERQNDCVSK
jgi:hypothetical protein